MVEERTVDLPNPSLVATRTSSVGLHILAHRRESPSPVVRKGGVLSNGGVSVCMCARVVCV